MTRIKRALRLFAFMLLLLLAILGMGICGAIPIPPTNKKEEIIELVMEQYETEYLDESTHFQLIKSQ